MRRKKTMFEFGPIAAEAKSLFILLIMTGIVPLFSSSILALLDRKD